jgi:hypothetical protein
MFSFTPSQLKKRLHALAARHDDRFLDLAVCLGDLQAVTTAAQFRDAVAGAGLGSRKAYYLVNIAEKFSPHMRSRARLQKLGWTKCQMIAAQLPDGNFGELLERAEQHTAKELDTFIRRKTTTGKRCVLLYFTPREYSRYEQAAITCGARKRGRGLVDKEKATLGMVEKVLAD